MPMISSILMTIVAASAPNPAKLPYETALSVAQAIGRYDGYRSTNSRRVEYEVTDKSSSTAYPGFITVQIRTGAQAVFDVSVETRTGFAADFLRCLVFRYPIAELRYGRRYNRRELDRIMKDNGCVSYSILTRRGDEARNIK